MRDQGRWKKKDDSSIMMIIYRRFDVWYSVEAVTVLVCSSSSSSSLIISIALISAPAYVRCVYDAWLIRVCFGDACVCFTSHHCWDLLMRSPGEEDEVKLESGPHRERETLRSVHTAAITVLESESVLLLPVSSRRSCVCENSHTVSRYTSRSAHILYTLMLCHTIEVQHAEIIIIPYIIVYWLDKQPLRHWLHCKTLFLSSVYELLKLKLK